jgi:hypothetical protein
MPFISADYRRRLEEAEDLPMIAPEVQLDPTFGEVFSAQVGLIFDEELSISRYLNQEMFKERENNVRTLIDEGVVDPARYEYNDGKFDYNKLSLDLDGTEYGGMVKPDSILREERNQMLARRREYAESVIGQGSGLAQFLGAATGYMLDPINIATMPLGTVAAAAKGLTAYNLALSAAGRTAAITTGSEAAIQLGFVYDYKQEIDSPYSMENAYSAILAAGVGGAAIGAVQGGLVGAFRAAKERTAEQLNLAPLPDVIRTADGAIDPLSLRTAAGETDTVLAKKVSDAEAASKTGVISDEQAFKIFDEHYKDVPRPAVAPEDQAIPNAPKPNDDIPLADRSVEAMADIAEAARAERFGDFTPSAIQMDADYQAYLRGEYDSLVKAGNASIRKLKSQRKELASSEKVIDWIDSNGGLNKAAWEADGIDKATWEGRQITQQLVSKKGKPYTRTYTEKPKEFPSGFWKDGDEGLTPDGLVELMKEDPRFFEFVEDVGGVQRVGANDALLYFRELLNDTGRYIDPEVQLKIDDLDEAIDNLAVKAPPDPSEGLTGDLKKAANFVKKQKKPFRISPVQKHLKTGYNPTVQILDDLESRGIITKDPDTLEYTYKQPDIDYDMVLDKVYRDARIRTVEIDGESIEMQMANMRANLEPSRVPENYPIPEDLALDDMAVMARERELLDIQGAKESYDIAMTEYEQLPADKRKLFIDGAEVEADAVIKEIDDQLEDIDNLMRCVRGE